MEPVIQVQILYEAICISLCINVLGKDMNPSVLSLSMSKIVGQLVLEKENSELKPTLLCFRNDLVSHPACSGGVG